MALGTGPKAGGGSATIRGQAPWGLGINQSLRGYQLCGTGDQLNPWGLTKSLDGVINGDSNSGVGHSLVPGGGT
jgi:hypothetical protein